MYYNITADRTEYPYILPDDVKPWSYMKWKIKEEYKTATLNSVQYNCSSEFPSSKNNDSKHIGYAGVVSTDSRQS